LKIEFVWFHHKLDKSKLRTVLRIVQGVGQIERFPVDQLIRYL